MKPDAHMPFYGNDFFAAVEGYADCVQNAYMRALWHYWHHTHAEGIPDDDDYMRRVCRRDMSEWSRVRGVIFGNFFQLKDGKWHQDRMAGYYSEVWQSYQNRVAGAAKARFRSDNNPDIKPDNNPDIIAVQSGNQNQNQNQSQNAESEPKESMGDKHPNRSKFVKPTVEELKLACAKTGLPEEQAWHFFNYYEANGWRVGRNPMKSWTAALAMWKSRQMPIAGAQRGQGCISPSAQAVIDQGEFERITRRMDTIRNQYGDHQDWDQKDRAEFAKLKARRNELKTRLNVLV